MALIKIDRENFLHIKYCGESASDPKALMDELMCEASTGSMRDTVLEFVNSTMIFSSEIGAVVQYLKTLQGTEKTLYLAASNYVCEMLKTMNINKIPNIALHCDTEELRKRFPGIELGELG